MQAASFGDLSAENSDRWVGINSRMSRPRVDKGATPLPIEQNSS